MLSLPMVATLVLTLAMPLPALAAAPQLVARVSQDGLAFPWDVAFTPGGQMFVTERPGRVRVYANGSPGASLLATSRIPHVHAEGEAGVMGIAVDPAFDRNRLIYVCASRDKDGQWINQVIRYRVTGSWTLQFNRYIVKNGMRASTIHNGCAVEVGPDLKVWISMGDANRETDAQNPNRRNGKILRVNRGGTVPSDNPILPRANGRSIIYSMGHRNPQGITFDLRNGRAYAVEHGPSVNDEINWIRPGKNYGWPCVTGNNAAYHNGYAACSTNAPFTKPAWHSVGGTLATSGGTFVRGTNWDSFANNMFVSTLKQSDLRRFRLANAGTDLVYSATYYDGRWGRLRAAVLGPGNRLFLTTSNGSNDKVIRITPT
jgi:glucose/arabinose dehydrogenase